MPLVLRFAAAGVECELRAGTLAALSGRARVLAQLRALARAVEIRAWAVGEFFMMRRFAVVFACFVGLLPTYAAEAPQVPVQDWRDVDPNNLVLIDTRYGEVAVELAPEFAPKHVERVRALIRAHFYDGLSFYRVIDGFVAQGGIGEGTASTKDHPKEAASLSKCPALKAEFERPIGNDVVFTPLGNADLFAPEVGHVGAFPTGRDSKAGRLWMIHCPGTFAFARDNGADTATTEFYIVIGEAPRRLDRNLSAFGRVI